MTEALAIEIAKSKIRELDVKEFVLRYRHIRLDGDQRRTLSADNEFYIIVARMPLLIVTSKAGVYDLQDESLRELQHVHTGKITLINTVAQSMEVKFLQVIPKVDKKQ